MVDGGYWEVGGGRWGGEDADEGREEGVGWCVEEERSVVDTYGVEVGLGEEGRFRCGHGRGESIGFGGEQREKGESITGSRRLCGVGVGCVAERVKRAMHETGANQSS